MRLNIPLYLFLLLTQVISGSARGEELNKILSDEAPEDSELEYLLQPFEDDLLDFLNTPHEIISGGVEVFAQEMDLFFADEKVYHKTTSSYARFSTQLDINDNGTTSLRGDVRLKIDLKETKKKLNLLLESDTDRDLQTGTDSRSTPGAQKESSSFFAALQREISKERAWKSKASLGIKFKVPLDPFIRFRISREFNPSPWQIRFTETLFWFNSKGTGASSLLEMDYPLSNRLLFRSGTSDLWTDFLDYHEMEQILSLYHEITDRRAVSYSIGAYGISEPHSHLERYYASFNYRQRIHRDWLFIEISPSVVYERENNFQSNKTLMLKLEMVFGNEYVFRRPSDN